MNKELNVVCLILWTTTLVLGVVSMVNGKPISEVSYVCALLGCILHHIEKIMD